MNYETVCNLHAYFMLLRKYTHTYTEDTLTYIQHTHTAIGKCHSVPCPYFYAFQ